MRRLSRPSSTATTSPRRTSALRPTPLGEGVTGLLVDEFKSVADYEFTANMEHELDEVEAGKLNYIQLLHNFYDGFEAALKQAEIDLEGKRIKIQDEVTDVICDKCGRNMVIKSGRFGKFLACPGFPECTNTKPITEDTGAACPVCGAKVVKKKSARGYVYYSCDKYPACQFITWDKPLKTQVPELRLLAVPPHRPRLQGGHGRVPARGLRLYRAGQGGPAARGDRKAPQDA